MPLRTDLDNLIWLAGWQIRSLIVRGSVSAEECTRRVLRRIQDCDGSIHAYVTVDAEGALGEARKRDAELASGGSPGPLFGIPISVKDIFAAAGLPTTGGSLLYRDRLSASDSVAVERLRAAGAVLVGKTNTPEFAMAWKPANRLGPETVNPWDSARTPGGSSGGAAASVATGMAVMALGSDGGGSIRMPAAFCGVFGLLPSRGRVPFDGHFGRALGLSATGPITRDVRDAATMLGVLAGPDARDPLAQTDQPPDYSASLRPSLAGLRVALWLETEMESDARAIGLVRDAYRLVGTMGASLQEGSISLGARRLADTFYVISNTDRYATFGHRVYDDPMLRGQLTDYARAKFASGVAARGSDYSRAAEMQYLCSREMDTLFRSHDLLISPTVALTAPLIQQTTPIVLPPGLVTYLHMVNFTGVTAGTVPCGFVDGMPVGVQVIGPKGGERVVLRAMYALEKALWPDGLAVADGVAQRSSGMKTVP